MSNLSADQVVYDCNVYLQFFLNRVGPGGCCVSLALARQVELFVTPAMQAGLSSHVWEIEELAALVEAEEQKTISSGAMKRGKYKTKVTE